MPERGPRRWKGQVPLPGVPPGSRRLVVQVKGGICGSDKTFQTPSPSPQSLSVHGLSWMSAANHSTNSCWASGLGKFSFKNMNSQYNEAMKSVLVVVF